MTSKEVAMAVDVVADDSDSGKWMVRMRTPGNDVEVQLKEFDTFEEALTFAMELVFTEDAPSRPGKWESRGIAVLAVVLCGAAFGFGWGIGLSLYQWLQDLL